MIRTAVPADAPALAAVLGGWVRDTDWMPKLHSPQEDVRFVSHLIETMTVVCAEQHGFLARDGDEIPALYLAPEARGCGLGGQLLDAAKTGRDRLVLWTFLANTGARRFYDRHGFTEIERTDGKANECGLPDVRLEWRRP